MELNYTVVRKLGPHIIDGLKFIRAVFLFYSIRGSFTPFLPLLIALVFNYYIHIEDVHSF